MRNANKGNPLNNSIDIYELVNFDFVILCNVADISNIYIYILRNTYFLLLFFFEKGD